MSCIVFFFKQKTADEMRISDWSSDVCSSDLATQMAGGGDPVLAALVVLAAAVAMQAAMQGGYLLLREPEQMRRVLRGWRVSGQVGLLSALGSACWFTGFATAPVALVRIVGQVEVARAEEPRVGEGVVGTVTFWGYEYH